MSMQKFIGGTAAVLGAGIIWASLGVSQAAMRPVSHNADATVHLVDCAVGAHLGPLGACILGDDDHRTVVEEHRTVEAPDPQPEGCATKSVTRTDSSGNSETKTKTNC